MNEVTITGSDYNENYYKNYCGNHDYINNRLFIEFFKAIAAYIKKELNPKTVLDAGCACGHLVAALRDLDIDAYGVDISEYAISQVRDDIKPYCAVSSLTSELPENFPTKYDLVTNIEVLEHMYEEDSIKSLNLLCQYSDMILFSSSPDDFAEKTHVNVQPVEYWIKHFAQNGFFPNMAYYMDILPPQAMFFERSCDYQSLFANLGAAVWREKHLRLKADEAFNLKMDSILNSFSWKITKPLRFIPIGIQKIIKRLRFAKMNIPLTTKKIWGKINPVRYWDLLVCPFRKDKSFIREVHDFQHDFSEKLCVFSSFNRNGIVPEATYFQLSTIRNEGFNIFFVSTSTLNKNDVKLLGNICSKVIIKKNTGYDWGAYLTGLKAENYKFRKQILLINDSIFGPLFPLSETFSKMAESDCDCWGLTDSYEKKFHLQSYFLVINQKLLQSKKFEDFWDEFKICNNRLNVIKKYELGFSQYLIKHGFKLDAYIPYKKVCFPPDKNKSNMTHFFWKELICQHKLPFIKKDFLLKNPMRISDHPEWEHVIKNNTEYDIALIETYINQKS